MIRRATSPWPWSEYRPRYTQAEQSAAADGGPFIGFSGIMPGRPPLLSFGASLPSLSQGTTALGLG
jgi:hypothetical protein